MTPKGNITGMSRFYTYALALLLTASLACRPPFNPKSYPSAARLYEVALAEFKARRFDNAKKAFEQLTLDLAARDPRLPLAFYYLAQSHNELGEHLLARSEEHTSELQSPCNLVCRLLLEKKKKIQTS